MVDPDLPPPGPPTMRSFKVRGASLNKESKFVPSVIKQRMFDHTMSTTGFKTHCKVHCPFINTYVKLRLKNKRE